MCIGRRAGGFWLDLCCLWPPCPHSHMNVFSLWGWGLPFPFSAQSTCLQPVMSLCLPAVWRRAHILCRCLIIVFQRHAGYCQTIHSIFCSASIGHFPRIPLFQLFFFYCSVMFQYVLTEEPVIIGQNYLTASTVGWFASILFGFWLLACRTVCSHLLQQGFHWELPTTHIQSICVGCKAVSIKSLNLWFSPPQLTFKLIFPLCSDPIPTLA